MKRILILPDRLFTWGVEAASSIGVTLRLRAVKTGAEALRVLGVWKPNLVIMSNDLPDMDPSLFLSQARELVNSRYLLVTESVGTSADVEVDAHLVEPLEENAVLETVGNLLETAVRHGPRVAMQAVASVERRDGGTSGETANVVDVSENGCQLEMGAEVEVGAKIRLRFFLPESGDAVEATAEIRTLLDEFELRVGCQFIDISDRCREQVRVFADTLHGLAGD